MVRSGQPLSYFPFVEGERIAKATVVVHAMRWKWMKMASKTTAYSQFILQCNHDDHVWTNTIQSDDA